MPERDAAAERVRDSRFLSRVLRHAPGSIGLSLDAQGWVDVDALLAAAGAHGRPLTAAGLRELVDVSGKRRFAFDADGRHLRAVQGHSVDVDLGLAPRAPPARLYHGTAMRTLDAILREGLSPRSRRHVHLSDASGTARAVGARHGRPVVLEVDAEAAHAGGHAFFRAENGVWLTDRVPPLFLRVLDALPGAA